MNDPKLSFETIEHCPVCNSKNYEFWSDASDLLTQSSKQIFEYSCCSDCCALFMSKRPCEKDIGFFYREDYHPYLTQSTNSKHNLARIKSKLDDFKLIIRVKSSIKKMVKYFLQGNDFSKLIEPFYLPLSRNNVFVDFGCGAGKYLNKMKAKDCRTIGVDFSDIAINSVIANNHEGYLVSDFWTNFGEGSVDFVRMNHVVEHLYHPNDVIHQLASRVRKGGGMHIAVPNPVGISAKLFRKYWHGLDCPRHVILYPPNTLIDMLKKNGFSKFVVFQEPIAKDLIRSVGYLLASINLYDLSKVNNLMYSRILNMIFWFPARIASLIDMGDRYHIICIKS